MCETEVLDRKALASTQWADPYTELPQAQNSFGGWGVDGAVGLNSYGMLLKEAAKFASQSQKAKELPFLLFWRRLEIFSSGKLALRSDPKAYRKEGMGQENEHT